MMKKVLAALTATTMIAGVALTTAPAASAASPRTTVDAWYADFLGRDADADPGSQYWVGQIEAGARPSDQVWAITHTGEYNAGAIDYYYSAYLGRTSDRGANYWYMGANNGAFPLEWVTQNIVSSPEFVNAAQRRNTLVQQWYAVVFGEDTDRLPSAGEVAYWNGRVRAIGALGAFRELYYAPEVVSSRVAVWYSFLLRREAGPGEIAYWYPKEVESDINVGVLIASTPEYADRDRSDDG